jgi:hypothetical protein
LNSTKLNRKTNMGTPLFHANKSAERFGGNFQDYLPIHTCMDSSKSAHSDMRHKALTHNSWFTTTIIPRIFGPVINNSEGKSVSTQEVAEFHVMEDLGGSLPSASDYLNGIPLADWMDNGKNGDVPPSQRSLPTINSEEILKIPEKKAPDPQNSWYIPRNCGGGGRLD